MIYISWSCGMPVAMCCEGAAIVSAGVIMIEWR